MQDLYVSGDYLKKNPRWHADESSWKVKYILQIMRRNSVAPKTIGDVGCGAGKVLKFLQERMDKDCLFWGYDISPKALELAQERANERLQFKLADFCQESSDLHFDLILLLDVLEHMEDYFSFLREIRSRSSYKIIQLPLDISVQEVLWNNLIKFRGTHGHLHYFTKDLALQMLQDTGYQVIDYMYTWPATPLPFLWNEYKGNLRLLLTRLVLVIGRRVFTAPKQLFFVIHKDLAARLLGGWRLLVLVK